MWEFLTLHSNKQRPIEPFLYARRKSVVLWYGAVRPSVRPSLSTGVTPCWINSSFTYIIHLLSLIQDTGSSLDMHNLQIVIFLNFDHSWDHFSKADPSNLAQLEHLT